MARPIGTSQSGRIALAIIDLRTSEIGPSLSTSSSRAVTCRPLMMRNAPMPGASAAQRCARRTTDAADERHTRKEGQQTAEPEHAQQAEDEAGRDRGERDGDEASREDTLRSILADVRRDLEDDRVEERQVFYHHTAIDRAERRAGGVDDLGDLQIQRAPVSDQLTIVVTKNMDRPSTEELAKMGAAGNRRAWCDKRERPPPREALRGTVSVGRTP